VGGAADREVQEKDVMYYIEEEEWEELEDMRFRNRNNLRIWYLRKRGARMFKSRIAFRTI
jgi:hypothetical protein